MFGKRGFTLAEVLAVSVIAAAVSSFLLPVTGPTPGKGLVAMKDANSAGSLYWADYDSALMLAAYGGNGQTQLPANPPVVFLHYDYMLSTDPALPHSHEPNEGSIDLVVEAYRRHGITLLIDPEHTVIPEHQVLRFYGRTCGYQDEVNFYNLKTQYFHPKGNLPCTT